MVAPGIGTCSGIVGQEVMVAPGLSTDGDFHLLPLTHHPTHVTDHHHLMITFWLLSRSENVRMYIGKGRGLPCLIDEV